jgi:transposase
VARHTVCTIDVTARVCEHLRRGGYAVDAAVTAGIDESTFYDWMRRGKKGEEPFAQFAQSVKAAKRERVQALCEQISSDPTWQAKAWLLERTDPKRFGRNDRVKLDAKVETVGGFKDAKSAALAMERMLAALKGMAEDEEEG